MNDNERDAMVKAAAALCAAQLCSEGWEGQQLATLAFMQGRIHGMTRVSDLIRDGHTESASE